MIVVPKRALKPQWKSALVATRWLAQVAVTPGLAKGREDALASTKLHVLATGVEQGFGKHPLELVCDHAKLSVSTRLASENLILASTAARGVPCRHGNTACIPARGVGTDPTRSASLYSGAGSVSGNLGIHGPRLTGAGPHVTGTAKPNLTEFFTPPFERPATARRPRRPRSHRRRGGQPGHPGHTRTLIPVEDVDEVVVIKPEQCAHCQAPLAGDDPQPWCHQVIELPPIKPVVTEYQWHQLRCSACGEVTRAPWPDGVPSGTYGPRVQATVALCTGAYRLSKRTTQQMMNDVLRVPVRVGTINQLEQATTEVRAGPVEEARTYVQAQAVAHLDETSWRRVASGRGYGRR